MIDCKGIMHDKLKKAIKQVHELLIQNEMTISSSESCTGGLLSHYLTYLPGSSAFFIAGVVAYSVESKKTILSISSETLRQYGTVSIETAKEMAERIRSLTGSDIGISTTGNLGPDVLEGKERGLVYVAVSKKGSIFKRELRLRGSRQKNKEMAALEAMNLLIDVIKNGDV